MVEKLDFTTLKKIMSILVIPLNVDSSNLQPATCEKNVEGLLPRRQGSQYQPPGGQRDGEELFDANQTDLTPEISSAVHDPLDKKLEKFIASFLYIFYCLASYFFFVSMGLRMTKL